jgi:hypothetical protein
MFEAVLDGVYGPIFVSPRQNLDIAQTSFIMSVTMRSTGNKPFGVEPTFFVLMFSKRVGGRNQYFTVYIEL